MKSFYKTVVCLLFTAFSLSVQAQMTNYTKSFLNQRKQQEVSTLPQKKQLRRYAKSQMNEKQVETIACFVVIDKVSTDEITKRGGVVSSKLGDQLIVVLPVDSISSLAKVEGVRKIDVSRPLRKKIDKARSLTQVEDVFTHSTAAQTAGLQQSYDGTGVVLGIIDTGIEFNHVAFQNGEGNSRVKAVYLPNADKANGGTKKVIDGETLMGYEYTTEAKIKKLTTDDKTQSHGTHTASTAAGTRVTTTGLSPNVTYGGMAPNADVILCGLGEDLSNAAVAASALYIADYAKTHNQPCVISVSLGDNMGPHDGSSSLTQFYDELAEEYGAVILLAAGNEADLKIFLSKKLTADNDYVGTILGLNPNADISYTDASAIAGVDIWNSTSEPLEVAFVIFNEELEIIYTSPRMSSGEVDKTELAKYFKESTLKNVDTSLKQGITVEGGVDDDNNRYNLFIDANLGGSDGYELGMLVYGKDGNEITMWNDGQTTVFSGYADGDTPYTFLDGDGSCSICDDVTGKKTISVGAYASRLKVPIDYGKQTGTWDNGDLLEQDIAYFSSYGTDFSGVQHPFIAAPGHSVVAAINRYDKDSWKPESGDVSDAAYRLKISATLYDYWSSMSGTSMATPTTAGIVALFLQADNNLKVADVKEVMTHSADTDSFTTSSETGFRFGVGKINALKGIQYILGQNSTGIMEIEKGSNAPKDGKIYNLKGQRVRQMQRGINIVNGKKVIL